MEKRKNGLKNGLQKAIDHFGGVAGLAKALRVERQAIYMWKGKVPEVRAYQIEVVTNGIVKAADLLPREARA